MSVRNLMILQFIFTHDDLNVKQDALGCANFLEFPLTLPPDAKILSVVAINEESFYLYVEIDQRCHDWVKRKFALISPGIPFPAMKALGYLSHLGVILHLYEITPSPSPAAVIGV